MPVNYPQPLGGTTIPSNLTGTVPPGWTPPYGGSPVIPDPTATQATAIGGDLAELPYLFNLANQYNQFNYGQRLDQVKGTAGYDDITKFLSGEIPQDVKNKLAQAAAERGVSTGTIGSPNADAALLASMGLTSLDLKKTGMDEYDKLLGLFPGAEAFDMSKFLVTPDQEQAAMTAANVNAAAPNPKAAADAELDALLKAIMAGKTTPTTPPPPGGGTDLNSLINLLTHMKNPGEPPGGGTTNPKVPPGGSSVQNPDGSYTIHHSDGTISTYVPNFLDNNQLNQDYFGSGAPGPGQGPGAPAEGPDWSNPSDWPTGGGQGEPWSPGYDPNSFDFSALNPQPEAWAGDPNSAMAWPGTDPNSFNFDQWLEPTPPPPPRPQQPQPQQPPGTNPDELPPWLQYGADLSDLLFGDGGP